MSFSVTDFQQKMNSFTKASHFEISWTLPPWAASKGYSDNDFLRMRCHRVNLPGIDIQGFTGKRGGSGIEEFFPQGAKFNQTQMSIYNDENSKLLNLFRDWISNIIDIGDESSNSNDFRVNYRDNYLSTLTIDHFNPQGEISARYILRDAFPVDMGDIGVSWDATDQLVSLNINIIYKSWSISKVPASSKASSSSTYTTQPNNNLPAQNGPSYNGGIII